MTNGPIEFFKEECPIENPYFLYDPLSDQRYDSFKEATQEGASSHTFAYLGVEQLPAELPIDASEMFSEKLSQYIPSILLKAYQEQNEIPQTDSLPNEILGATITDSDSGTTLNYSYLS